MFFEILRQISDNRRTPLLLDVNFFEFLYCRKLFELCLIKKNHIYSQDETIYDFREITKLQKKLNNKENINQNEDSENDSYDENY